MDSDDVFSMMAFRFIAVSMTCRWAFLDPEFDVRAPPGQRTIVHSDRARKLLLGRQLVDAGSR